MKKLSMLGIVGGAALLAAVPFSLQWSQETAGPAVPSLTLSMLMHNPTVGTVAGFIVEPIDVLTMVLHIPMEDILLTPMGIFSIFLWGIFSLLLWRIFSIFLRGYSRPSFFGRWY